MPTSILEIADETSRSTCLTVEQALEECFQRLQESSLAQGIPRDAIGSAIPDYRKEILEKYGFTAESIQAYYDIAVRNIKFDHRHRSNLSFPAIKVQSVIHDTGVLTFPNGSREDWKGGSLRAIECDGDTVWEGDVLIRDHLIRQRPMVLDEEPICATATRIVKSPLTFDPLRGWYVGDPDIEQRVVQALARQALSLQELSAALQLPEDNVRAITQELIKERQIDIVAHGATPVVPIGRGRPDNALLDQGFPLTLTWRGHLWLATRGFFGKRK